MVATLSSIRSLRSTLNKISVAPLGKLYPCGFFSLYGGKSRDSIQNGRVKSVQIRPMPSLSGVDGNPDTVQGGEDVLCLPSGSGREDERSEPLGLSMPPISHKRAKRGSKGCNPSQRRKLFWAVSGLQWRHGRANLSFLTLTLPNLNTEDYESVTQNWSEIVRRFVQELKRELGRNGVNSAVFGCNELQLARGARESRNMPHLHLVFRGRKRCRDDWAISPEGFRAIWRRIVEVWATTGKYDWRAVENVLSVRKSASGYLAKYLSKSASKEGAYDAASGWIPSDWVVLGRLARRDYLRSTRAGESVGEWIRECIKDVKANAISNLRRIEVETRVGMKTVGWCGRFMKEFTPPSDEVLGWCGKP